MERRSRPWRGGWRAAAADTAGQACGWHANRKGGCRRAPAHNTTQRGCMQAVQQPVRLTAAAGGTLLLLRAAAAAASVATPAAATSCCDRPPARCALLRLPLMLVSRVNSRPTRPGWVAGQQRSCRTRIAMATAMWGCRVANSALHQGTAGPASLHWRAVVLGPAVRARLPPRIEPRTRERSVGRPSKRSAARYALSVKRKPKLASGAPAGPVQQVRRTDRASGAHERRRSACRRLPTAAAAAAGQLHLAHADPFPAGLCPAAGQPLGPPWKRCSTSRRSWPRPAAPQ